MNAVQNGRIEIFKILLDRFLKNSMPLSMRHAPAEQTDSQREHIKEVIEKFQRYKPKPITDNRITKFVFTNDADLATSKTVQEHNKVQ